MKGFDIQPGKCEAVANEHEPICLKMREFVAPFRSKCACTGECKCACTGECKCQVGETTHTGVANEHKPFCLKI